MFWKVLLSVSMYFHPFFIRFVFMCRPLLSMKMSFSKLASLTSFPSEYKSLQTCQLGSVECLELKLLSTGHCLRARSVCCALVCPRWLLPCDWLQKQPQIQCGTDGSVPTASHFHKQMSDNLMITSSPLPPCTHTSSPHASWLTSCSLLVAKCHVTSPKGLWCFVTHSLPVILSGHGRREWPGDRADDRYGGACHG